MNEITTVEQYLKQFGHISPIYAFLAKHGRRFKPKPLPKNLRRGRMKECFLNAFNASQTGKYRYVEGCAAGIIPTMHAWVTDDEGNAYDVTWKDGKDYFGVTFNSGYVLEAARRTRHAGILVDPREANRLIVEANLEEALWRPKKRDAE